MPRKDCTSNGTDCIGDYFTGELCTLSRARGRKGKPIIMSVKSKCCRQWRCAKHCKHQATRVSRGAPASKAAAAPKRQAQPHVRPAVAVAAAPSSRTPPFNAHLEVFFDEPWLDKAIEDVQHASSIILSATMYDDPKLHNALLAALRRKCSVEVMVDEQNIDEGACRGMKTRLLELKRATPVNARVLVCTDVDAKRGKKLYGPNGLPGVYHLKVLCIDGGKVVWHGGSNVTKSSRKNIECMSRVQGPAAEQFLAGLAKAAQTAKPF